MSQSQSKMIFNLIFEPIRRCEKKIRSLKNIKLSQVKVNDCETGDSQCHNIKFVESIEISENNDVSNDFRKPSFFCFLSKWACFELTVFLIILLIKSYYFNDLNCPHYNKSYMNGYCIDHDDSKNVNVDAIVKKILTSALLFIGARSVSK